MCAHTEFHIAHTHTTHMNEQNKKCDKMLKIKYTDDKQL